MNHRFKKGSILILTMWALCFLSAYAINSSYLTRTQLNYVRHFQNRYQTYYFAYGGIERAVIELSNVPKNSNSYNALNESWANNEDLFKNMQLGDGFVTLEYSVSNGRNEDEKEILYGIEDECSKININTVSANILATMLERIAEIDEEEAEIIAASIVDWRDVDVITSAGGAENEYYQKLKPPYECKNRRFEAIEELLLVKKMSLEIFAKIKNVITIYGTGKVNINTAGFNTFYALGFNESVSKRIIEFRQGKDGKIGTEDDGIFQSIQDLMKIGPLFTEESTQINSLISKKIFTVKSDTFRIKAIGELKNGNNVYSRRIICVLEYKTEPKILYWHVE